MPPRSPATTALVSVIVAATLFPAGCRQPDAGGTYQGYLEAEYVYASSPYSGALRELSVSRGDHVVPGQALFSLDPQPEAQSVVEAQERLIKAEAQLADTKKGQRPTEIKAVEALQESAATELQLAGQLLKRREQAVASNAGVISAEELDQYRSRVASLRSELARINAQLETARLGAREDLVRAAAADVDTAKAGLERASWVLSQKTQSSTVTGSVHDTLYRPGEWIASGHPVAVLLPPENIKVRFFVPEARLADIQPGTSVTVEFDGAPRPLVATVNYVSTRAEFTPPVIYSQQTRTKLVYMVEATFTPADTAGLRPGQPVDVTMRP